MRKSKITERQKNNIIKEVVFNGKNQRKVAVRYGLSRSRISAITLKYRLANSDIVPESTSKQKERLILPKNEYRKLITYITIDKMSYKKAAMILNIGEGQAYKIVKKHKNDKNLPYDSCLGNKNIPYYENEWEYGTDHNPLCNLRLSHVIKETPVDREELELIERLKAQL